jgi:aspartate racemase
MPTLAPAGGEVSWPLDEGVLGVVGVAPWATLEFCRSFYGLVSAQKDWHFPRVLLDINTKLPSRGRHLQLGERDPSPDIAETIAELAEAGATVAVVACNTAHILFDRWSYGAPIPVLNIVRESVLSAQRSGARRLLVLASASLAQHNLYGKEAELNGLACLSPPPDLQGIVNALIETIKTSSCFSENDDGAIAKLVEFAHKNQADTVLLGCTELSTLRHRIESAGLLVVDSNEALARAAYLSICSKSS